MFAPQIAQLAKRLPRPAFSDCVLFFFFVFLQCAMTYLSGPLLPSCITHTSSRMYWSFIAMHATHARCRNVESAEQPYSALARIDRTASVYIVAKDLILYSSVPLVQEVHGSAQRSAPSPAKSDYIFQTIAE